MLNRHGKTAVLIAFTAAMLLSDFTANASDEAETPKLAIELGAPFRDNAILQRDMKVPVYKTVGSKYRDNPYYLANVRRYIAEWKAYWREHIPAMQQTKAVPDGSVWGSYPSPKPQVGDSTATWTYNVYVHCFTPAALSGIVFLSGELMVADDQGANFGPEMSALAKCFKTRFGGDDAPFIYTVPGKALAPKITQAKQIKGKSVAVQLNDWSDVSGVIEAVAR